MKKHNLILLILVLSLVFTALPVYASDIGLGISPEQTATIEDQAAIFTLSITNNGATNTFEIFTLTTDFDLPTETVIISSGETKDVEVRLYPRIHKSGLYEANLLVRNQATRDMKEATARIRLFTLNDALWMRVEPDLLHVDDTKIEFVIKDIADVPIRNLRIEAESEIFTKTFELSLDGKQEKSYPINVDLTKAEGGIQNIKTKVYIDDALLIEKDVPYNLEVIDDFHQSKSITGFLIRQKTYTFENNGNTREEIDLREKSNIFEKIFSWFSERPVFVTEGGVLRTNWDVEVAPYETEKVIVKTNYLLPLILLALIIVGFAFTVNYQSRGLIVTKSASKAKSNRGSAFKVTVRVRNRKEAVRDVKVRDFLPKGHKVHEKFDFIKPNKIAENYVEWNLPLMRGGEERVFTYYVYTEDEFSGTLLLPHTSVNYMTLHREPKTEFSQSVKLESLQKVKVQDASAKSGTATSLGTQGKTDTRTEVSKGTDSLGTRFFDSFRK